MRIVVSGSTGLIGTALVQALKLCSHEVLPLVRRRVAVGEQAVAWDPERGMIDRDGLEGIDVVQRAPQRLGVAEPGVGRLL